MIADLKQQGAKINAWVVGTNLITGGSHSTLSGVYKLAALRDRKGWRPRLKFSANPAKMTDPGPRRMVRYCDASGQPLGDIL